MLQIFCLMLIHKYYCTLARCKSDTSLFLCVGMVLLNVHLCAAHPCIICCPCHTCTNHDAKTSHETFSGHMIFLQLYTLFLYISCHFSLKLFSSECFLTHHKKRMQLISLALYDQKSLLEVGY